MTTFLLATAFLFFALLVNYKKEWGVYLVVLLLPAYQIRFEIFSIPMTFLEGLILIFFIVVVFSLLKAKKLVLFLKNEILNRKARSILILLFLFAAAFSVFVAPDRERAAGLWKAFFAEPVIFFFLIIQTIDTREKLIRLFRTFVWLLLYLGIFGIYQFLSLANLPFSWWAVDVASRRIVSLVNHPNALALLAGPPLALLIIYTLTDREARKTKIFWAAGFFGVLTLFLSFSRAGWLAVLLSIMLFGFFTKYKKRVLTASLVAVLLVLTIPYAREKTLSLIAGGDPAQSNRIVLWTAAADIIKNNPVTGVGLQGFREAYKSYPLGPDRVVQNYPHNFFLNFWVETGLLGLAAILGIIILFYRQAWKLLKTEYALALAAACAMAVIILHGQADVPYFKNDLAVLFWTIAALPFLKQN